MVLGILCARCSKRITKGWTTGYLSGGLICSRCVLKDEQLIRQLDAKGRQLLKLPPLKKRKGATVD